jgi:hypothetical protein
VTDLRKKINLERVFSHKKEEKMHRFLFEFLVDLSSTLEKKGQVINYRSAKRSFLMGTFFVENYIILC